METLGIGLLVVAILGLVVYYVRKGVNAERDNDALEAQSNAQKAASERDRALLAEREREDRAREDAETVGVDRERANELLRGALEDYLN